MTPKIPRAPRIALASHLPCAPTMTPSKPLIDPKELKPLAVGLLLGLALMGFFAVMSAAMGQTLIVDHSNIPYQ